MPETALGKTTALLALSLLLSGCLAAGQATPARIALGATPEGQGLRVLAADVTLTTAAVTKAGRAALAGSARAATSDGYLFRFAPDRPAAVILANCPAGNVVADAVKFVPAD